MKVAWLMWLPVNGWVAEALKKRLNGNGEPVDLVPMQPRRDLKPHQVLNLVAELNEQYQAVAFLVNAVMVEAARNHKIQNFRKEGATFAQWLCPQFEDEGKKVRWCTVS
jgi:hypothetical protein